jgi:hypothetical protein
VFGEIVGRGCWVQNASWFSLVANFFTSWDITRVERIMHAFHMTICCDLLDSNVSM